MNPKIGVIGLGYVGLPLALAFSKKFCGTVGFDINSQKVQALRRGEDANSEGLDDELRQTILKITDREEDLKGVNFFIVGVPTPVDVNHNPDLQALRAACVTVGRVIKNGAVVVFESTVYPGLTEEICGALIAQTSGLKQGLDFKLGYSPERINPGDKEHTLERIVKVVSAEDAATLELVAGVYSQVVNAGVYRASSIRVAEAAKVIENTQRDLNIALMNELALIFDRIGISSKEVLDAASTKWNFMRFQPGLVGGHCIGVDPYYLTAKAEQLGYHPQVILAGRRINDGMGHYIAQRLVKLMANAGIALKGAQVGVLGITFKENVTDIRNSRVPDIISELKQFGVQTLVHDPNADPDATEEEYGFRVNNLEELNNLDGLVMAVPHRQFLQMGTSGLAARVKAGGVLADIKSVLDRQAVPQSVIYWSL